MSNNQTPLKVLGFIVVALFVVASPALTESVGEFFGVPLDFVTELLSGLAGDFSQFFDNFNEYIVAAGVSSPLVFLITALVKKAPYFADQKSTHIATGVGFLLYAALLFAQRQGLQTSYDNITEVTLLVLSLVGGTATTQSLASSIHSRLVDNPNVAIAYKRNPAKS